MKQDMKRSSIFALSIFYLVMLVASQNVPPSPPAAADLIDTHCHYVPPFYRDLLNSMNVSSGGATIPPWNASQHLAVNAEFGIMTSVVSISTPGAKLSENSTNEQGRALARQLNEYGHNLTVEYPGRFKFLATLTLPDLDGAVAEAKYALDTLGASGVIILASTFGELFGTRRYDPLYQVLDDRKAVIFVHPGNAPCERAYNDFPPGVVDLLLDTTRAALDLVFRNVTTDYPNMKILLAHSGGFLSFPLIRAVDYLATYANTSGNSTALADIYIDKLSQMNVDLALSSTKYALPSTTALFSSKHITFGSDYPYVPAKGIGKYLSGYQSYPFSSKERERINHKNANRLIKHN